MIRDTGHRIAQCASRIAADSPVINCTYEWPDEVRTHFLSRANAYVIANRDVGIVVVADVGPRVLSFRRTEGENQFYIVPEQAGSEGGDEPRLYGGHRLWAAPETPETFVTFAWT